MNYLDNQLCVQLYIKTRAIIRYHEKQLKQLGLTYPQALVLLVLEEKGSCFIDDITMRLFLDTGTLTPLLKKMERQGYIQRKRDTKDERRVAVSLTLLGKNSLLPIKELFDKTAAATCLPLEVKQAVLDNIKQINI